MATKRRGPRRSKRGPTWMPTKKTMKRYRLKTQPICDASYAASWCVANQDSKTAAMLMMPKTENIAQKEPSTTSHAVSPPSGKVSGAARAVDGAAASAAATAERQLVSLPSLAAVAASSIVP